MTTPTPLTFRLATPTDTTHLTHLINTAFRSEKTGRTWLYDSQEKRVDIVSPPLIEDFITGKTSATIMLVGSLSPSQNIVATCFLRSPDTTIPPPDNLQHITPGAAWLGFLAVDPSIHGKGLGKAMLQEAERYVSEEWEVQRLEFDFVSTRTELQAWYERQGYVVTGRKRPFFYGENGREILADGLEMVVLGKDLVGDGK